MKHIDEYRDAKIAQGIIQKIHTTCTRSIRIMEVCGTHTVSIFRNGIRALLPPFITLISGPGCPVCVTATEELDKAIKLSREPNVIVTSFGDLLRVPGSDSTLAGERAKGADVRMVYSTVDAIKIAQKYPDKKVVFLGIGFETTVPTTAASILETERIGINNFSVLSVHKQVPPALDALASSGEVKIDGLLCPGHVTTIIGANAYIPVVQKYHIPCVVAGFEAIDILHSIYMLVMQIEEARAEVEIQYKRGVNFEENKNAMSLVKSVFEPCDAPWRGLGIIPGSGLRIREEYRAYEAESHFDLAVPEAKDNPACICGDVLRGAKTPLDCSLFRKLCTPSNPIGPCMVSSEGTCAAYEKYHSG